MTKRHYQEICNVAGTVSRETFAALLEYESAFKKWAGAINLAGPGTLDQFWSRHVLDSAQLVALRPSALKWLDLGSGGGMPGAVVAILLRDRSDARVELVESNAKKVAFLQATLGSLAPMARVVRSRIEVASQLVEQPEIVTARALAPLAGLLTLSQPWLEQGAVGLFHKGRDYLRELEESRDVWNFDLVEHTSKVDAESRILEITALRKR